MQLAERIAPQDRSASIHIKEGNTPQDQRAKAQRMQLMETKSPRDQRAKIHLTEGNTPQAQGANTHFKEGDTPQEKKERASLMQWDLAHFKEGNTPQDQRAKTPRMQLAAGKAPQDRTASIHLKEGNTRQDQRANTEFKEGNTEFKEGNTPQGNKERALLVQWDPAHLKETNTAQEQRETARLLHAHFQEPSRAQNERGKRAIKAQFKIHEKQKTNRQYFLMTWIPTQILRSPRPARRKLRTAHCKWDRQVQLSLFLRSYQRKSR
jgi:hypothetical protein